MSFMGTLMGNLAARMAFPLMAAGGFAAYKGGAFEGMDLPIGPSSPSHYEMSARIVSIESACQLEFMSDGKVQRTQPMACPQAVNALKNPSFRGYQIIPTERATYIYYAPDGESTLKGYVEGTTDAQGRPYKRGDVIQIRVDPKYPAESEVI